MNRFKRLIALLLCIATMLSLMGNGVPTAVGEAAAVEAVEVTPAPEVVTAVEEAAEASCDYCTVTVAEDGTVTHEETCVAEYVYDGTADVGKYAVLNPDAADYLIFVSDGTDFYDYMTFYYDEFDADLVMKITDWYWEAELTGLWYQVEAYEGAFPASCEDFTWPETAWIMQCYTDDMDVMILSFVTIEEPEDSCDICGTVGCTKEHVRCDVCGNYDCVLSHVYCYICGTMDCTTQHVFCTTCGKYDCGVEHEDIYTPATAPVIPDSVTLPEGEVHVVADKDGNAVVGSFELNAGKKSSLSAWSKFDSDETVTDVSYKWQVRYDASGDLWTDIRGQQGKGVLMSPAMFLPLMEDGITPAIRSVVTANGETLTGDPIEITLDTTTAASSYTAPMAVDLADEETDTELTENYVVVRYEYSDGRNAASTDFAEIIPGSAYSHTYTLPVIPGYKASLNTHSYGDRVTLTDTALVMNFAENELTEDYAIFTVTYSPDYVNYTVIHYWQNVDNDNYTENERQTVGNVYKTGEQITNAHNTYDGFYNLLYEPPVAAADGSTVIEVYYDRYYYLMTFDLGDMGYGVEPVYARYDDTVEIGTPTRAGYTFLGWKLDGTGETIASADMPTTMPAENRKYVAQWQANDTAKVSVVIWGENPDDEGYSYLGTEEIYAKPGSQITWTANGTICGLEEHTHSNTCETNCGYEEHTHTLDDCYTLTCTQVYHNHTESGCATNCSHESHTHGTGCYDGATNTAFSSSLGEWGVNGTATNGRIGESYGFSAGNKYIYINGTWYKYSGSASVGSTVTASCGKTEGNAVHDESCYTCGIASNDHQHTQDACYELTCPVPAHTHTAACVSCGQPEHTHSDSCYASTDLAPSNLWTYVKSDTVTVKEDGSTVLNVYYDRTTFTLHFRAKNANSDTYGTIVEKWGANIEDEFDVVCDKAGYQSWSENKDASSPWTNYLMIMPAEERTYYSYTGSGTNVWTMTYYKETLTDGDYSVAFTVDLYRANSTTVSKEEFIEIEGFTINDGLSTDVGDRTAGAKFYYDRNSYKLDFNNGYTITNTVSVKYEDTLSAYKGYSPPLPDAYEAGSRTFAGWYLNPECTGERVNLDTFKMPAKNLILYAKWQPVEYKVNYYLTKESYDRGETIPEEMARLVDEAVAAGKITEEPEDTYTPVFSEDTVQHGSYITDLDDPGVNAGYSGIHPREGYKPIGWFYIDENGEEKAFDYENMPVTHDLDLYVKWSSDTLCAYNIYFVLDEDGDGVHDDGETTEVAAPISGSGIAGRTYTFAAKGGEALNEAYQDGYFPSVGSHSLVIDIQDVNGTGNNAYYFLYQQKEAMPYTVKYINDATGTNEFTDADGNTFTVADKVVSDNRNVVVTENFQYIAGYMPDAYQKTLVVTTVENKNVIEFHYTKDEVHARYVVNYYIEVLDENLNHAGWQKYNDLQNTGDIGKVYSADAITIDGFTLSASYTDGYNVDEKINGENNADLPADTNVSALTNGKLSGTLVAAGMELNFYYTRNLYPYEFRYVLKGTATELANAEYGKAGYDTTVSGAAKEIKMDLDGDDNYEDYRLYDPTETTKDIHISKDGNPLDANAHVVKGQATVNIATFEYIRCTQNMTIEKKVKDDSDVSDPDPNQEFMFSLLIHDGNGYHQTSYNYTKTGGESGTLSYVVTAPKTLQFSLKAGEIITIEGLPTAEYTLTELNVPVGYYASYNVTQENGRYKHTETNPVKAIVTNTYYPANLTITKTVDVVEEDTNTPEVTEFKFTIRFPAGAAVENTHDYFISYLNQVDDTATIVNKTADVQEGTETVEGESVEYKYVEITLKNGETAAFENLPLGTYVVTEDHYEADGYNDAYYVNGVFDNEGDSVSVKLTRGNTTSVECKNKFPVGDLIIEKTVTKEFYNTAWTGDTFTFTVERTTEGRPLVTDNQYKVLIDGVEQADAVVVDANGKLTVTIPFSETDAAKLTAADSSVKHTLTIKNLPAGTYSVTETADGDYNQTCQGPNGSAVTGTSVSNIAVPATDGTATAAFTNQLKRTVGSLYLEKELVAASGFNPDALPQGTKFSFVVKLTEDAPNEVQITRTYNGGTAEVITLTNGTITVEMEAGQGVTLSGLPIGKYRITEATIPNYANSFAFKADGEWVPQTPTSTNGQLFTDLDIKTNETAEVKCTNTYPVNRAELIIQKLVVKEYDRDTLPTQTFTFTVTTEVEDTGISSYAYKIYNSDGSVASTGTAAVTNKTFSIQLKAGQYAVVESVPVCGYTITETAASGSLGDYNVSFVEYLTQKGETASVAVPVMVEQNSAGAGGSATGKFIAGKTTTVVFTNKYKKHLGDLTIEKIVEGTLDDANQSFIFTVTGPNNYSQKVVINATAMNEADDGKVSGSVTVKDLPLGTYTVTEDTAWSWRYGTVTYKVGDTATNSVTLTTNALTGKVTVTNERTKTKWLSGDSYAENLWTSTGITQ